MSRHRQSSRQPSRRNQPGTDPGHPHDKARDLIDNRGKPDEMAGFRPGPGNTGSMDGREDTGHRQINHQV